MPADGTRDYEVGYGKPPIHTRFKKGNRANPRGRPRGSKNLATMLEHALDQPAAAEDGKRRLTKREVVIAQLVEKSARADLAATKLLFELLGKLAPALPADSAPATEEIIAQLRARLARLAQSYSARPPAGDTPTEDE